MCRPLSLAFALVLLVACDPGTTVPDRDSGTSMDGGGPSECPPSQSFCNGRCIGTAFNPLHCGGCGVTCAISETCEDGECRGATTCPAGQQDCGGCTDVGTDAMHCGRCGEACGEAESCISGACQPDTCPTERPDRCGDGCTNTDDDNANCGECGTKCGVAETCQAGTCSSSCDGTVCELDGASVCVDTDTDAAHCGACGEACDAGEGCASGTCGCPSGATTCGTACVNTDTDPAHCGDCGQACPTGASCVDGGCRCPGGLERCGPSCVNTDIDDANCGECEVACAGGESCVGGTCAGSCGAGQTMCGADCVSLANDAAHCGACGNACPSGTSCSTGVCRPGNDVRANARAIAIPSDGSEATELGSTDGATPDLPALSCDANGPNVWYRVTLPSAGVLWVDTAGSGYDTAIFVTDASGTQLFGMCNDDCPCGDVGGEVGLLESCAARRIATPGTYYISVGGYSLSAVGDFALHVQFLPDVGFTYSTRLNGVGTTSRTELIDPSTATGTCGGAGTSLSGEDMRWFVSCGGDSGHAMSLCPEDGGAWTRTGPDGQLYDPVMYVLSAIDGSESACNDDDFTVNCQPEEGGPRFGSRLDGFTPARGVHGVVIDSRTLDGSGMEYEMRYELPNLVF